MLGNIFQNGVLLITLLIVDILAVSNGAESKPPNNNKPICVIPKETVPEFALFEKKTEALLGKDQDATNIKDVKKIVEQMVDLKCQNAGGDPIGLKQINAKICSKGNEMLASEKKIQIEEMIDWAIGQLDKTSNSHSSEGCCLPKGKWMGQVKGQLDKAADEFENGHKLEVFAWIRRILANKCDLPTGKEFVQNLAKFWKELKEGRLFQQHDHQDQQQQQQQHRHIQNGGRRRRRDIHNIALAFLLLPLLLVMSKVAAAMFIGASAILTKTILVGFAMYVLAMGLLNP